MKIYHTVIIDMATSQVLFREGYEHSGEVALCKGASAEEKAAAASTASLNTTIQQSMQTMFANQQNVVKAINNAFQPILAKGESQQGFSPEELAARKTSVIENNAQQFANAKRATQGAFASRGGGNEVLPSGVEAQVEGSLAADTAAKTAAGLTNVDIANWETGRENFKEAAGIESGVMSAQGIAPIAGTAVQGSEAAFTQQSKITEENDAASPWAMVGGILGSVAGTATKAAMA